MPDSGESLGPRGGVAEWLNAAVSKTVGPSGLGGSNPPSSASFLLNTFKGTRSLSTQQDKMDFWKLHGLRIWTVIGAGIVFLALMKVFGVIAIGISTIAVTALIVFISHGLVNRFESVGIPRLPGTVITFAIGIAAIALVMLLVVPALLSQTTSLIAAIPGYARQLAEFATSYISADATFITTDVVNSAIKKGADWLLSNAGTLLSGITGGVVGITAKVGNTLLVLFISFIAALWILIDLPKISVEFRNLFSDRQQETLDIIAGSFGTALYGWAKSTFICAVLNGVICGVLFFFAGVPYSSLLGVAWAILYIIPYIGPILAYVLCGIVGLLVSPLMCLVTIAINLVVHNIVVNVISPRLMKTTVNVHPAVTLIAILIGEGLCGVLGMLLAVPVVAALQTIFVTYFETRTGKSLYTEDGALFQKVTERPVPQPLQDVARGIHKHARGE